jgi:hypothetical protein
MVEIEQRKHKPLDGVLDLLINKDSPHLQISNYYKSAGEDDSSSKDSAAKALENIFSGSQFKQGTIVVFFG